jgi:hypothetical protein
MAGNSGESDYVIYQNLALVCLSKKIYLGLSKAPGSVDAFLLIMAKNVMVGKVYHRRDKRGDEASG